MRSTDLFDNYLNGKLNAGEKAEFEQKLNSDTVFAQAFHEHKELIASLEHYEEQQKLRAKMKEIHQKEFADDAKILNLEKQTFARRYGKTAMVAASTALIAVLSTVAVLSAGGYLLKKQNDAITKLGLKVNNLEGVQAGIVEGVKEVAENSKPKVIPANYEGSAFAYNNKGYIMTSYHIVAGADSVFVLNKSMERTAAKVVLSDPKLDIALLKVANTDLTKNWALPFALTDKTAEIGEKVFTLGYPRKDMVYGEGSLSSLSGYSNDTCMYQISIPVNPGNSGGPLLDEQGNVIGLVSEKNSNAEATSFAVKSKQLIQAVKELSNDSILPNTKKAGPKNLKRTEQIKKINPYVFNVEVYKD